ncbi:hypothetical protein CQ12_35005 [Bradyrhizobium jicamae]|uniref:Uncharacterized protein n=2 Tax=Bradyrhizobium jicamae TaxID=280332 RepID=A0A0R3M3M1_9BRAD|nr:hypothetical protein CQ12_35005 [Bradyrhizobium jicamae]
MVMFEEGVPISLSTLADQVGGCTVALTPLFRRLEAAMHRNFCFGDVAGDFARGQHQPLNRQAERYASPPDVPSTKRSCWPHLMPPGYALGASRTQTCVRCGPPAISFRGAMTGLSTS